MQNATLEDTVYLGFVANNTSGSGDDGATAVYKVREGGAAASAAPTLSGNATLLTHANFPPGAYELAIAATAANGFSANKTYLVYCTLLVDSQNPSGFAGSFRLAPVPAIIADLTTAAKALIQVEAVAALAATVPDTIPADGTRPSVQSALYMISQLLWESSITDTTWTVYKPDGSTVLFTVTLNSSTTPTAKTRAT